MITSFFGSPKKYFGRIGTMAESKNEHKISVRNLVEYIYCGGDLDTRFMGGSRAVEGIRAHQRVQKERKREADLMGGEYIPEVPIKHTVVKEHISLSIEGRIDGVLITEEGVVIDEIKSTGASLSDIEEACNPIHWAQAKCYGYIYAKEQLLSVLELQLIYFQLDTAQQKTFKKSFTLKELQDFFDGIIDQYVKWLIVLESWYTERNYSIKNLSFPFETYRKGQRELAVAVYKTIKEQKKIFVQAPTGIGKTISTLFPAVKAVGEGHTSKIFYLTAKTIARQVAEEAFMKMEAKGLRMKVVTLTAKDTICFCKEGSCTPHGCEYAAGHFDRVQDAVGDIFSKETMMTRQIIEEYAAKHRVCPFEFALDLTLWSDCIICDYNYVFDPRVHLRRFFQDNGGAYTFLVDESHNLVDRARDMFSAQLSKRKVLDVRQKVKGKATKVAKILNKINSYFLNEMKQIVQDNTYIIQGEEPKMLYPLLHSFIGEAEQWLQINAQGAGSEELLELYFDAVSFMRIAELYDERYSTYLEAVGHDGIIKLFCIDPSYLLMQASKRGRAAVFFSATLTPLEYFRKLLGGVEADYMIKLPSPFDPQNLLLLITQTISTKYKDRESSYGKIAEVIYGVVSQNAGNYLIFFPSYHYMQAVYGIFIHQYPKLSVQIQTSAMKEEERAKFLSQFQEGYQNVLGFAVLGGIFSEGIDLVGERLVGAIVVGVGLPQICLERDLIMNYFNNIHECGYEYAYMYPGMNKVLQAAGRVIRSEADRGVVVLIDDRFNHSRYINIFPQEWSGYRKVNHKDEVQSYSRQFWDKATERK